MSLLSPSLEAFLAVAQLKTVHGAARQLHITQTAITQRIRVLETKLRTTLFIRTRRGMQLTTEGEALLRYCLAASDIEGKTLSAINGAGINATVTINITGPTSVMSSRVMPGCFKIMKIFPALLIHFDINDADDLTPSLRSGDCQFAIIKPENLALEMKHKILKPEHYVLVSCLAWKKRALQDIIKTERIIDFNAEDKMTFNYLQHFGLLKYTNHERHYVNRTDALAELISAGFGYGVLTQEFANHYINEKQLCILNNNKTFESQLALAWYDRPEPPAYFKAIIESIR